MLSINLKRLWQTHPMAAPTSTDLHFKSKDGTDLVGTFYSTPNAKANAIIVHGYAEHGARYTEVVGQLNEVGLNAMHFDLRGHGKSAGARGFIGSFDEYLQDLEAALEELTRQGGDLPVLLIGHSNGGLIALHLLSDPFRCPKSIKAAVISSPFLDFMVKAPAKKLFARAASFLVPKLALPNKIGSEVLTHDPEKAAEHDNDPLCHDVVSTRWFTETTAAQGWVEEFANRITVPTLWLVSGMDQLADPKQTKKVHAQLTSESSYHEFANMHHEVFNEVDRKNVFALMKTFCEHQF